MTNKFARKIFHLELIWTERCFLTAVHFWPAVRCECRPSRWDSSRLTDWLTGWLSGWVTVRFAEWRKHDSYGSPAYLIIIPSGAWDRLSCHWHITHRLFSSYVPCSLRLSILRSVPRALEMTLCPDVGVLMPHPDPRRFHCRTWSPSPPPPPPTPLL